MPKRFTATEKWKDLWFKKLEPKYKLLWIYLLDECDNAGLIELDLDMAGLLTGYAYSLADLSEPFGDRLFQITQDVWFIPKFISFQYPKGLSTTDNNVKNVVMKLKKHNLISPNFDLIYPKSSPSFGRQDMDKDMDKDKDKDIGQKIENFEKNAVSEENVEKQAENDVIYGKALANATIDNTLPELFPVGYAKAPKKKDDFVRLIPPELLFLEKFGEAWLEWIKYKTEIRNKVTESTAKKQLAFLLQHKDNAVAIINQSIQSGWKGLFELNNRQNGVAKPTRRNTLQDF